MRLGVVSDTHNHLANAARIVAIFNRAGVDRVVHTGDITQAKTLEVFADLDAPLTGVFGNNDLERPSLDAACARLGLDFHAGVRRFAWSGRSVLLVHDRAEIDDEGGADLILHGHNHRTVIERNGAALVFNPGECAGHLAGHNSVGFVDLRTLQVWVERF